MNRLTMKIFVYLAACLAPLWLAGPGRAEVVDRIVAVVNDEIITLSELEQAAKMVQPSQGGNLKSREEQELKKQLLEALIDRKLAKAEAKRRGITISDKEIDQAIEDFKKNNRIPDDAALQQALGKAGLNIKDLRQQLADQLQQERLVHIAMGAKKVEVSEAEVRRFYDENFRETAGNQVHLRMVNLPFPPGATEEQKKEIQQKTEAVLKDLRLGRSLAEVQQKHSIASQDLGFINQADLDPRIGAVMNKLRPGEIAPLQSPQGFQLVILVGRRSGKPRSFEEVAPEIRRLLASQALQKQFVEWVKTLRGKAHIKVML